MELTRDTLAAPVARMRAGLGADDARVWMTPRGNAAVEQDGAAGGRRGAGVRAVSRAAFEAALARLGTLFLPVCLTAWVPNEAELVVVPHGALDLVPLAALPVPGGAPPLGVRHTLRDAPSSRALSAADVRPVPGASAPSLVVADLAMPQVRVADGRLAQLEPLAAARRGVAAAAKRLGAGALTGAEATEGAVRASLSSARLVHLATHGLALGSEARVRDSCVALAPRGAALAAGGLTADRDGPLTLGELLHDPALTVAADPFVPSAC